MILAFGSRQNHFYRELFFESIRAQKFAERPSRVSSAFAFEAEAVARAFNPQNAALIYGVSLSDPHARTIRVDMTWVDALTRGQAGFDKVADFAGAYWRGDGRADQMGKPGDMRPARGSSAGVGVHG